MDDAAPGAKNDAGRERLWLGIALAWGFAEATFFFIVPDVWTSRLALRRPRTGFLACLASLAGALLGGTLLHQLGQHAALREAALALLDYLPGIAPGLIEQARASLTTHGWAALFVGILGGIPYKLYALQAAPLDYGLGLFLVASAAARLGRFLLVTAFSGLLGATLLRNLPLSIKLHIHTAAWAIFYAAYFWRMGV